MLLCADVVITTKPCGYVCTKAVEAVDGDVRAFGYDPCARSVRPHLQLNRCSVHPPSLARVGPAVCFPDVLYQNRDIRCAAPIDRFRLSQQSPIYALPPSAYGGGFRHQVTSDTLQTISRASISVAAALSVWLQRSLRCLLPPCPTPRPSGYRCG